MIYRQIFASWLVVYQCNISCMVTKFQKAITPFGRTSELRSKYFSALTAQSVNKCLVLLSLQKRISKRDLRCLQWMFPFYSAYFKCFTIRWNSFTLSQKFSLSRLHFRNKVKGVRKLGQEWAEFPPVVVNLYDLVHFLYVKSVTVQQNLQIKPPPRWTWMKSRE